MIFYFIYFLSILIILLSLIVISCYIIFLIYSLISGSLYIPTNKKIIKEILKEANLKKGKVFVELGSGDGRVVRAAVDKYQVKGIGVDINPLLIYYSKFLARKLKSKILFIRKNIFDVDLRKADYLYLFLMPKLIEDLTPKMERELKKGAIVISHGFPVKKWEKKLYKKLDHSPFPTYYYRLSKPFGS